MDIRFEEEIDLDGRHTVHAIVCTSGDRLRLSPREAKVLELVAHGASGKEVAYTLGVAESTVSTSLRDVAARLGIASSISLTAAAASVLGEALAAPLDQLTSAERSVLALVRDGLSNSEIALRRGTATRTIANQVASMLRKTSAPSRRALVALTAPRTTRATRQLADARQP